MSKRKPQIQVPTVREDAMIQADIQADPDNPEWTEEDFIRARPATEMLPKIFGEKTAQSMLQARKRSQ